VYYSIALVYTTGFYQFATAIRLYRSHPVAAPTLITLMNNFDEGIYEGAKNLGKCLAGHGYKF
jgi:hypothetical protein